MQPVSAKESNHPESIDASHDTSIWPFNGAAAIYHLHTKLSFQPNCYSTSTEDESNPISPALVQETPALRGSWTIQTRGQMEAWHPEV